MSDASTLGALRQCTPPQRLCTAHSLDVRTMNFLLRVGNAKVDFQRQTATRAILTPGALLIFVYNTSFFLP